MLITMFTQFSWFLQWEEFLKLGDEIQESAVEKKIDSQKSNHCAELFYSVSYTILNSLTYFLPLSSPPFFFPLVLPLASL